NLVSLIMMDSYTPVTVHTSPSLNPDKVASFIESSLTVSPSLISSDSSSPTSILPFNFTTLSGEQNPILPSCFLTPNLVSFIGGSYIYSTVHTSPTSKPDKVASFNESESNLTISPSLITSSSSSTITSYSSCITYAFIPLVSMVTPSESLSASWTTVSMSPLSYLPPAKYAFVISIRSPTSATRLTVFGSESCSLSPSTSSPLSLSANSEISSDVHSITVQSLSVIFAIFRILT